MKKLKLTGVMLMLVFGMFFAQFASAQYPYDRTIYTTQVAQTPAAETMVIDLLVGRPLMFLTTLVGTGIFVLSLPFTALAGDIATPRRKLVEEPGIATFNRCLGCPMSQF